MKSMEVPIIIPMPSGTFQRPQEQLENLYI